jgi:hypothetical protein
MRDHGFSFRAIAAALGVSKDTVQRDIFGNFKIISAPESEAAVSDETPDPVMSTAGVSSETPHQPPTAPTVPPVSHETPDPVSDEPPVSHETPAPEKWIRGRDQKSYPAKRPNGTRPTTSPADRQLAQVINLLMGHAQQWSDQHWQAFLEVVQNLRGDREPSTSHSSGR